MKTLLIIAHTSRQPASNQEVQQLTQKLSSANHSFTLVNYAFLELAPPPSAPI